MKVYFDTLTNNDSNQNHLTFEGDNDYWIVAPGAPIKNKCSQLGLQVAQLNDYTEPGIYFIDVRGDPQWWAGVLKETGTPHKHILRCLPKKIIKLVKQRKLRIILNADREGGPMVTKHWDCFLSTHNTILELKLPKDSVLILQGNKKVEHQYRRWRKYKSVDKMYDMMYSNHFGNIFVDANLPTSPVIKYAMANPNSKDYNSLNRVYRPQRGAHLYRLMKDGVLNNGIVSGNEITLRDKDTENLVGDYQDIKKEFPKFIDGDWSKTNAANQYNVDIYKNSLLTVITETIFFDDVAFVTEKIFKPITMGHPLVLFASQGTLRCLEQMGFRTDWCGIDPVYNDIEDNLERFNATQQVINDWIDLPESHKIARLEKSMDTIQHNFDLIRRSDFYADAIHEAVARTEKYYETI
jgi:hypothetical protein